MRKRENATGQPDTDEWSIDRFERWVRLGVESYVLEELGPAAFPEAAHHILITGSLPNGLREFAAGLSPARLDNLKRAIALVLSSLEPRERYVAVAEQLLAIAVAVSAYPVLDVLAQKIGGGFFGQADADGLDSLFAMTLYSVARLATPGRQDAERCLNELIESENFRPAHASTALIALCQVDPRGLTRHLSAPGLRDKLSRQFAVYDTDGSVRRKVAQDILSIIGMGNLKQALYGLDALNPFFSSTAPDDWLTESLIFSSNGPLEIVTHGDAVKLRFREAPEDYVVLDRRSTEVTSEAVCIDEPPANNDDLMQKSPQQLGEEVTAGMTYLLKQQTVSMGARALS